MSNRSEEQAMMYYSDDELPRKPQRNKRICPISANQIIYLYITSVFIYYIDQFLYHFPWYGLTCIVYMLGHGHTADLPPKGNLFYVVQPKTFGLISQRNLKNKRVDPNFSVYSHRVIT